MEIDKLPNVKKYWINDGYLNIELKDNHRLRMNFNNIETLKKQLILTDVVSSFTGKEKKAFLIGYQKGIKAKGVDVLNKDK